MKISIISIFLLITTIGSNSALPISEIIDIAQVAKDVIISLAKIWKIIDRNYDTPGNRFEGVLMRSVKNVNEQLNQLSEKIEATGTSTLMTVMRDLPQRMRLELKLNDLIDYLVRIHVNYRNLQNYIEDPDIEQHTLEDFSKSVVSHDLSSVLSLLERIHAYIVPIGYGLHNSDLINLLKDMSQVSHELLQKKLILIFCKET